MISFEQRAVKKKTVNKFVLPFFSLAFATKAVVFGRFRMLPNPTCHPAENRC
jgi:hypothetical protein